MNTKKLGMVLLEGTFVGTIAVASRNGLEFDLKSLIPLGLATFRMARTISFNEIAEPIREPFTEVLPDSCGAGSDVHPKGTGLRYVIGSLLACPICSGTWSAMILMLLWTFVPDFGKWLVYILAIAGISEILHYFANVLEWSGRLARVSSGKISPDQN